MKKTFVAAIGMVAVMLLSSCAGDEEKNVAKNEEVHDIKALVSEYSGNNKEDQSAAITSHELIITNEDKSQEKHNLPQDEFFVSIAPYITNTHP